jgi:hypothetical protein
VENKKRHCPHIAALITSVALILSLSSVSSVIEPFETTGSISVPSKPASKRLPIPNVECPRMDIRQGASTLNIKVKPKEDAAGDSHYQLSFGQTTHECRVQDGTMSIKVAVQGSILSRGFRPALLVEVPLRYTILKEGPEPKIIVTKFKRIRTRIAPKKTHVQFVDIEGGLSFALPSQTELAAYVVYVGFDKTGEKNESNVASTARKPARHEQWR